MSNIQRGDRVKLTCAGNTATGKVVLCSPNRKSLAVALEEGLRSRSGGLFVNGLALSLIDEEYRELRTGEVIEVKIITGGADGQAKAE